MGLEQWYVGYCDNCGLVLEPTLTNDLAEARIFLRTQEHVIDTNEVFCDIRCAAREEDRKWESVRTRTISYEQFRQYQKLLNRGYASGDKTEITK